MRAGLTFTALVGAAAACLGLTQCKGSCEDAESCGVYPALPYCDGIWRMRADGSLCSYCPKRDEDDGKWYWPDHGDEWVLEPGREFFLPLESQDDPDDPRLCGTAKDGCDNACPDTGAGGMGGSSGSGGTGGTTAGGMTAGGAAGQAGSTSSSGGGMGGTSSGGDGGSGASGGSAGTGELCDGACTGSTPVCDETTDSCVECLDSAEHCEVPTPACDPDNHECVECLETTDCDEGVCDAATHQCVECLENNDCEAPTTLCNPEQQLCVECLGPSDCGDPQASFCDAGSCSPCQTNEDCAHLADTTVCDVGTGECVECTGTDYASCGSNEDDEPLVCNSLTRTCSEDQVEHGSNTCEPCVSDANCPLGQMCVLQTFDGQDVGYFCHWLEGDTEYGAPAECFANGRPYVDQTVDAVSIDNQTADICGLRVSTCPARNDNSDKDCAPEGIPDDSICGFDPPNDAKCAHVSGSSYRCTMRCNGNDDCPGTDCNTGPLEPVCEL